MIAARNSHRDASNFGRQIRASGLWACFSAWRGDDQWRWNATTGFVHPWLARRWAAATARRARLQEQAHSWFRMEQAAYYTAFGDRLQGAMRGASWTTMQKIAAELKPRQSVGVFRAARTGTLSRSYAEE